MAKPTPAKAAAKRRKDAAERVQNEADRVRSHERFVQRWNTFRHLGGRLIIAAGVIGTAYVVFYLPVTVAPGGVTVVSLTQNFVANVYAHVWMAWGTAAAAGTGWYREHRARIKEREEKDRRLREFEKARDPNVSTSGLNADGTALGGDGQ